MAKIPNSDKIEIYLSILAATMRHFDRRIFFFETPLIK
jgi:hypothetical protein